MIYYLTFFYIIPCIFVLLDGIREHIQNFRNRGYTLFGDIVSTVLLIICPLLNFSIMIVLIYDWCNKEDNWMRAKFNSLWNWKIFKI